jgi:NAD(P)-dependent dehydrogenase (short-subunit alcohol dehydrogenase family)
MIHDSSPDLLGLRDKTFVLVGGGAGLGVAIAKHFSSAGARIFCVDRDQSMADLVANETGAVAYVADALDRESLQLAFKSAQDQLGPIHGVIDIIGIARLQPLARFTDEDWNWQFDLVVRHAFLVLQIGAEFIAGGGSFTLIGSLAGDEIVKKQTVYGAAKAALHHLARGAALEYGERNVRVNVVAPGFIRTPRLLQILAPDMWQRIEGSIPLRRAAEPKDIAGCVLFLASDLAAIVTGQVIGADGGVSVAAALPDLEWQKPSPSK